MKRPLDPVEMFQGTLTPDELLRAADEYTDGDSFMRRLEKESAFEAACALCRWPSADLLLSEQEWRRRAGMAVRHTVRVRQRRFAMAAAAVLAACVSWWAIHRSTVVQEISMAAPLIVSLDSAFTARTAGAIMDSIESYPIREHVVRTTDTLLSPITGQAGVVSLGTLSGALVESGAVLRVSSRKDEGFEVLLSHGAALFAIEPGVFRQFSVRTPHALVSVVGTIFRVTVDSTRTSVQVLEGAVRVVTHSREWLLTTADETDPAWSSDSAMVTRLIEQSATVIARRRILGSYLAYLTRSGHDIPDASAAVALADSCELVYLADGAAIQERERRLLYVTGRRLERKGRALDAVHLYGRVYAEQCGSTIGQLAAFRAAHLLLTRLEQPDSAAVFAMQAAECASSGPLRESLIGLAAVSAVRAGEAAIAIRAIDSIVASGSLRPDAASTVFACAQLLRLRDENWHAAGRMYSLVVDSFPGIDLREDALYWASWCLAQEGVRKRENRFLRQYDSSFPQGSWRPMLRP